MKGTVITPMVHEVGEWIQVIDVSGCLTNHKKWFDELDCPSFISSQYHNGADATKYQDKWGQIIWIANETNSSESDRVIGAIYFEDLKELALFVLYDVTWGWRHYVRPLCDGIEDEIVEMIEYGHTLDEVARFIDYLELSQGEFETYYQFAIKHMTEVSNED